LFPEKFERRDSLDGKVILILVCGSMLGIMALISAASHMNNLNGIKSKTVGDGQHGAARFATGQELARTFRKIPYAPQRRSKSILQTRAAMIVRPACTALVSL